MSKKKQPPVCPYACESSEISQIIGRTPRSTETLRKAIDKALDTMFAASASGRWNISGVRWLP